MNDESSLTTQTILKKDNILVVDPPGSVVKRKRGRPSLAELEARKRPGKRGRPINDTGRIQEFKARLLSTTGTRVIEKIVSIAMDDNHNGQMAALKMCIDRMLPLSMFEKDARKGSGQVSINISVAGDATIASQESDDNVIDMEEDED